MSLKLVHFSLSTGLCGFASFNELVQCKPEIQDCETKETKDGIVQIIFKRLAYSATHIHNWRLRESDDILVANAVHVRCAANKNMTKALKLLQTIGI